MIILEESELFMLEISYSTIQIQEILWRTLSFFVQQRRVDCKVTVCKLVLARKAVAFTGFTFNPILSRNLQHQQVVGPTGVENPLISCKSLNLSSLHDKCLTKGQF